MRSAAEIYLTMAVDALCIAGLFVLKQRLKGVGLISYPALAAGLGLFVIRVSSEGAWWTGHLVFTLEPRQAHNSSGWCFMWAERRVLPQGLQEQSNKRGSDNET
jgi:hypothetical protein